MPSAPPIVLAIHDMSGIGRCSLSVISPIMSAMGVQVAPIPTAILSTHTGGLGDVALRDLTDFMIPALNHYKALEIEAECIYTGFLSSEEQIDHCLEYFSAFPKSFKVVDPVMGDNGIPYRTYTKTMCSRMTEIVIKSHMITPNLTEASILLGKEYTEAPLTSQQLKSMLCRLSELGPKYVVITGVKMADGSVLNAGYDRDLNGYWKVTYSHVPTNYPGTGDMYTAALVAGMMKGDSLPIAMERATRFLELAIKTTFSYGTDRRYGVMFETSLPQLIKDELFSGYEVL